MVSPAGERSGMDVSSGRSPSAGRRERREVVRRGGSGLVGGAKMDGSVVKASLSLVGSSEGVVVFFWEREVNSSGGR